MHLVYLAGGAFLGAVTRYLLSILIAGTDFPYATMSANLIGSFFMGIVLVLSYKHWKKSPQLRMLFAVGLLGSFTTFSTYTLETLKIFEQANIFKALLYYILSPLLGILCATIGAKTAWVFVYKNHIERGQ